MNNPKVHEVVDGAVRDAMFWAVFWAAGRLRRLVRAELCRGGRGRPADGRCAGGQRRAFRP
jgi:hypothetical protein